MRRIVQIVNSANSGVVIPINFNNVAVAVTGAVVVTGTVNYTINHTYDDVFDPTVTKTWWPDGQTNLNNATTSQELNFLMPIAAIQVIINSGSGSVAITILEQGII